MGPVEIWVTLEHLGWSIIEGIVVGGEEGVGQDTMGRIDTHSADQNTTEVAILIGSVDKIKAVTT